MGEGAEGPSGGAPAEKKDPKGDLGVQVVDACTKEGVPDVAVAVGKVKGTTNSSGIAELKSLRAGGVRVAAERHFADQDYLTFIMHYPKITIARKALSKAGESATIVDKGSTSVTIPLAVFKRVEKIVFCRKHLDLGGEDQYGHWWTEIDDVESYGWWPKYPIGSEYTAPTAPKSPAPPPPDAGWKAQIAYAAELASYKVQMAAYQARLKVGPLANQIRETAGGVEGELNGMTSFGGTPTRDPHHGTGKDESYQPVKADCRDDSAIKSAIRGFAASYSGGWAYRLEFGKNCHSFQIELMRKCDLEKVRSL